MLWVLIGWQFALAEYIGGLVMIALMWGMLRLFVSRHAEEQARAHAQAGAVAAELHGATWRDGTGVPHPLSIEQMVRVELPQAFVNSPLVAHVPT